MAVSESQAVHGGGLFTCRSAAPGQLFAHLAHHRRFRSACRPYVGCLRPQSSHIFRICFRPMSIAVGRLEIAQSRHQRFFRSICRPWESLPLPQSSHIL